MAHKVREDLTGRRFNQITVLGFDHFDKWNKGHWLCRCDCGKIWTVETHQLKSGKTKACGCLKAKMAGDRTRTHNQSKSKLYWVWSAMIKRCENPNDAAYKNYGMRGIAVCPEWHSFENFQRWAMSAGYQEGLTIERTDNNKGYSPENCTWATRQTQSENRRSIQKLTIDGKTLTISEWARRTGIDRHTIQKRITDGCPPELILKNGYVRDGKYSTQNRTADCKKI